MRIPKTALAGPLAVALAIPAFAIGQPGDTPNENAQPAGKAYGVVCQRKGLQPGSEDSRSCVTEHRKGVNGQKSALAAARAACRVTDPPGESRSEFGECVSSTRTLILGLRGLKAQP